VRSVIETTEETLRRMRSLKISVWCEHCGTSHKIPASDARVVDELPEDDRKRVAAG
jgi:hypothetical protein